MQKQMTSPLQNKGNRVSDFMTDYTVIDIETTGLSCKQDEIIEVSGIKIRNNQIIDEFTSLIKPSNSISLFISDLTGITNEMLVTAPKIEQVLPEFMNFIGGDIILGHNVRFDINFLYNNYLKLFNKHFSNDYIDTRALARQYCNASNNKLSTLARFYGIDATGHHRALNDCHITFNLYKKIMEIKLLQQ